MAAKQDNSAENSEIKHFENWMENMAPRLCCEPLTNIAIPGSHNSFSFFLDCKSAVSPGSPDTVRNLVSVFGDSAKQIISNWSVTQSLNFKQQLNLGIRYFDLRVSCCPNAEGFFFVHGLYGEDVLKGLREINEWLNEHPKEVIILDFNHLYSMQCKHDQLAASIEKVFSTKLCPEIDIGTTALNVLWAKKWQVIAIYHDETATQNQNLWPGSCIHSVWPNTAEAPRMVNVLEAHHTRGRPQNKFYVSQGILTPTGTTILQHIFKNLKDVLALPAVRNVKFFLRDKSIGPKGVNIIITDFVEIENFVETVLALNPKE